MRYQLIVPVIIKIQRQNIARRARYILRKENHTLGNSRALGRNVERGLGFVALSVGIVFLSVLVSAINIFLIRIAEALSMSLLSL